MKDIQKIHNDYLGGHKAVFTDGYSFKPYMIDEAMKKKKKQPKFIKTGVQSDVSRMGARLWSDGGQYARGSTMLQSCGGFK